VSAAAAGARSFTVADAEAGARLDVFLVGRCPDLSRHQVQLALAAGLATVDGRARPKNHRLRPGSEVRLETPVRPPAQAVPQDLPLAVVHADADLLVIDKAPGQVVHPAPGHPDGTVVNALLHHCRTLAGPGARPGIVHRLDRDTSGLMAVALSEVAYRSLGLQLGRRTLGRVYLALSWGRWPQPSGTLTGDIGRNPTRRQRMAVLPAGGRPAVTHYEVTEEFDFAQLCRVRLETGRTHQIRVHFAHAGHPVVGDRAYGDDARARNVHPVDRPRATRMVKLAERQMLHAAELSLLHPRTGEPLVFRSPLPADMAAVLAALRGGVAENLA
jgi:23S rRNA pseudouridine1911/1915/1917 synthase